MGIVLANRDMISDLKEVDEGPPELRRYDHIRGSSTSTVQSFKGSEALTGPLRDLEPK